MPLCDAGGRPLLLAGAFRGPVGSGCTGPWPHMTVDCRHDCPLTFSPGPASQGPQPSRHRICIRSSRQAPDRPCVRCERAAGGLAYQTRPPLKAQHPIRPPTPPPAGALFRRATEGSMRWRGWAWEGSCRSVALPRPSLSTRIFHTHAAAAPGQCCCYYFLPLTDHLLLLLAPRSSVTPSLIYIAQTRLPFIQSFHLFAERSKKHPHSLSTHSLAQQLTRTIAPRAQEAD
ncbi:hypothetical protein DFH27DRAFT_1898 [Peziza echinospora]|nr:hypothetical protein DFH27DRAFT_1898 [Peziza echinospora]